VDALKIILARLEGDVELRRRFQARFNFGHGDKPLVLITGHRRESFGDGFERICSAIRTLASAHDFQFIYPVHLNPNVKEPVNRMLGGLPNVHLIEPIDYLSFVFLLSRAAFVITDSGGVQEEAVSIGKHVIVLREVTERPEGVEAGLAHLVGTDVEKIISAFRDAMIHRQRNILQHRAIYGDGFAARRIVDSIIGASSNNRETIGELVP
jgi:UDP-N-acetylglucosamine 2-epimerase (non-hydrolysing)